jgi:hypothetical protein
MVRPAVMTETPACGNAGREGVTAPRAVRVNLYGLPPLSAARPAWNSFVWPRMPLSVVAPTKDHANLSPSPTASRADPATNTEPGMAISVTRLATLTGLPNQSRARLTAQPDATPDADGAPALSQSRVHQNRRQLATATGTEQVGQVKLSPIRAADNRTHFSTHFPVDSGHAVWPRPRPQERRSGNDGAHSSN